MTQPKAKWIEDNRVLRQKNTYFNTQLPKVKKQIETLKEELKDTNKKHQEDIMNLDRELMKETVAHNETRRNFEILSSLKMEELLGIVAPYEGL